jgi:hypothetical protein
VFWGVGCCTPTIPLQNESRVRTLPPLKTSHARGRCHSSRWWVGHENSGVVADDEAGEDVAEGCRLWWCRSAVPASRWGSSTSSSSLSISSFPPRSLPIPRTPLLLSSSLLRLPYPRGHCEPAIGRALVCARGDSGWGWA